MREISFMAELRREKFDLVINLTGGDRGAIIARLSGAPVRVGSRSHGKGIKSKNRLFTHLVEGYMPELHTVEHNLQYLSVLGVSVAETRVTFPLKESDLSETVSVLKAAGLAKGDFFHAHLTSRWMFKTMPPERAAQLVDMLAIKTGLTAVFTASPDEKELDYLRRVLALSRAPRLDLSGRLSLQQLGALSSLARFFAGVDSAPMHMAAALDIPVFAVFGPSSVVNWGPWDNRLAASPYRQQRGIQSTGRHLVLQSDCDCVPCHRDGCNGSKVSDCLAFDPNLLTSAVAAFLKENSEIPQVKTVSASSDNA
jgi:heptosyltransferase-3